MITVMHSNSYVVFDINPHLNCLNWSWIDEANVTWIFSMFKINIFTVYKSWIRAQIITENTLSYVIWPIFLNVQYWPREAPLDPSLLYRSLHGCVQFALSKNKACVKLDRRFAYCKYWVKPLPNEQHKTVLIFCIRENYDQCFNVPFVYKQKEKKKGKKGVLSSSSRMQIKDSRRKYEGESFIYPVHRHATWHPVCRHAMP